MAKSEALAAPGAKANLSLFFFSGREMPGAGAAPLGTCLLDGPGACVAFPCLPQPGGDGSPRLSLSSVSPLSPAATTLRVSLEAPRELQRWQPPEPPDF